jgi:peptidoglycan hydrolase-like protein with peptidoglycan-binding domain
MLSPVSSMLDALQLNVLKLDIVEQNAIEQGSVADVVATDSTLDVPSCSTPSCSTPQRLTAQRLTAQCSTMLVQGDSGAEVMELQRLLWRWSAFSGYSYPAKESDDQFDRTVRVAVETFQAAMFLQPNGVVGALTWRSLYSGVPAAMPTLQLGDCGADVARLQRILMTTTDLPLTHSVSNTYDLVTEDAVRQAQVQAGLTATGIVDAETWRALSRAIAYSRIANTPNQ